MGIERKCDDNNNRDTEPTETPTTDDGDAEKVEKVKPKQMVGLFPLDLRSELKQRIGGGIAGFSLKKSVTNVDVLKNDRNETEPISIRASQVISKPDDLLKSIGRRDISRKVNDDSDDDGGMENLSFKEKLQLIERSSSKNLINPL